LFFLFTVAHPKELAWIVRSKKKNDRVDSLKVAKLHMVGCCRSLTVTILLSGSLLFASNRTTAAT
jgi:hypothetical protein